MKVVPSISDITTCACSCKVASAHTYRADNSYKEPSINLDTNTKSNKNLDKIQNQQNKNITEKLISTKRTKNESTVPGIKPRKKRKRTNKVKDMNMARKLETLKTMYQRKNRKLFIF